MEFMASLELLPAIKAQKHPTQLLGCSRPWGQMIKVIGRKKGKG
jgi:hypothetical protein